MTSEPDATSRRAHTDRLVVRRLLWSKGLRAFADGYMSVLLPVYLLALGFSSLDVGIVSTATLLGSGVLTLTIGLHAHRFQNRSLLLAAAILMALTGGAFISASDFLPLLCVAFFGTLNPSRGDVSIFLPLEHATLARHVRDSERTGAFARYAMVGSLVAAFGSFFAGFPELLAARTGIETKPALQLMFLLYAFVGLGAAVIYWGLPRESAAAPRRRPSRLGSSKATVYKLAALFSLDAFGGGLVVDSMVALWLFQKYELSTAVAGSIFLWLGVLSAFSYPVAVRIARRIGLVNTMVFTHLPSNLFLALVPFMPSATSAIAMLLLRSALSQMDVPARSSFVMAMVPPEERPAAASITTVPRSFAAAAAPALSGYLLSLSSFGLPFVIAGCVKGAYDVLLLLTCRKLASPPEEIR
jgi:MFS family permease